MKEIPAISRTLPKIEAELRAATTYAQWLALAGEHDRISGAEKWREDDQTDLLHVAEIRRSIASLRKLRRSDEAWKLSQKLQEVLFRHQGEFLHPELYHHALCGTKRVVGDFLDEVESCVRYLVDAPVAGIDNHYKLDQLKRIGRVYGRPALLLSGGAVMGIFHLGVVKALFEQDLLPRSISGSSMGSIIAAWACTHNDDELRHFFANPQLLPRNALRPLKPGEMLNQRTVMDQPHLLRFIKTLVPNMTFSEAMRHSRRILNISVCPYHTIQSARLLNYLSAPSTLIHHTALASSAVPGAFKPVQLMSRQRGKVSAWMKGELWVDGSVSNDLPFTQLAQLLNINHFITSQANPHVVPFQSLSGENRGSFSSLARMYGGIAFDSWSRVLDVARRKHPLGLVRGLMNTAHGLVSQRYASTDMHIQMPFKPSMYPRVMKNPNFEQLEEFIRLGQQATWPQIPMIQDRTRLSRLFGNLIGQLQQSSTGGKPETPLE